MCSRSVRPKTASWSPRRCARAVTTHSWARPRREQAPAVHTVHSRCHSHGRYPRLERRTGRQDDVCIARRIAEEGVVHHRKQLFSCQTTPYEVCLDVAAGLLLWMNSAIKGEACQSGSACPKRTMFKVRHGPGCRSGRRMA